MDPIWYEFRSSPNAFLIKNKTNVESLLHDLLQILYSEDKDAMLKLNVLVILQEYASFLLDDLNRTELVLATLRNIFDNYRSVADQLFISEVLVTITDVLVQSEFIESLQQFLMEFVSLLFEIIEKIKSEPNRLLRAIACDCLKELESSIPGLLCDVIGHFYSMSKAENSFIHQHYMVLFSTVLHHYVCKISLMSNIENSDVVPDDNYVNNSLRDILFHSGRLQSFEPPAKYWKYSKQIASLNMMVDVDGDGVRLPDGTDQSELRKAVAYLIDHCHLFTYHVTAQVIHHVMCIISYSELSPMMLKSLLLRYSVTSNLQLCHLILYIKLLFGSGVCDDNDDSLILRRLIVMGGHPNLPTYHCSLVIGWLLHLIQDNHEQILNHLTVSATIEPSVFDNNEITWFKVLLFASIYQKQEYFNEIVQEYFRSLLSAILKPVLYGIGSKTARILHKIMYLFCELFGDQIIPEIERSAIEILMTRAEFTLQAIDLLSHVDKNEQTKSISGNVLSEASQWLLSLDINTLYEQLDHHLHLCTAAAKCRQVRPQLPLQFLKKIITESKLCEDGSWSIGNAVLSVICILMKNLLSNDACKELADLLLIISKTFKDIDIRDRARLYLQILLTVSNEKLCELLSETEIARDLSQVVVANISNNEYQLAPPIKTIEGPVFKLTRTEHTHHSWSPDTPIFSPAEHPVTSVDEYIDWLSDNNDNFTIQVPCSISLLNSKPDEISDKVYALVFQLSAHSSSYKQPNDIQIPSLSLDEKVAVVFDLKPVKSFQTTFEVKAIFTNEDGNTCTSLVHLLHIPFHELYHIPPVNIDRMSIRNLFDLMWERIESEQYSKATPEYQGILSAVRLNTPQNELRDHMCSVFNPSCVLPSSDNNQCDVIMFLPPQSHILLKIMSKNLSSVVKIACDNWQLLPFIGDWLKNLN